MNDHISRVFTACLTAVLLRRMFERTDVRCYFPKLPRLLGVIYPAVLAVIVLSCVRGLAADGRSPFADAVAVWHMGELETRQRRAVRWCRVVRSKSALNSPAPTAPRRWPVEATAGWRKSMADTSMPAKALAKS